MEEKQGETMMNLTFYCQVEGNTGFGKHARELSLALNKKCNLKLVGQYNPNMPRELKKCFEREDKFENVLLLTPPTYWESVRRDYVKAVGYGIFEGTKVPTGWVKCSEKLDRVIVPSTHTKEAFVNQGFKRVTIVPHGVNREIYNHEVLPNERLMNEFKDRFKFLFVGGWCQGLNDRKGAQHVLKAYSEAFTKEDNVLLIMKYNMSYCDKALIDAEVKSLNLSKECAPIIQIFDELEEKDLASLYSSCDVLVSPHYSESWGMAMSEAIACGKSVIATRYGGIVDYGTESVNTSYINGELVKAVSQPMTYYEEAEWMQPNFEELKTSMRMASKGLLSFSKGKDKLITWNETADKILEVFEKLWLN